MYFKCVLWVNKSPELEVLYGVLGGDFSVISLLGKEILMRGLVY